MTLHAKLRPDDKRRAGQAVTAWLVGDQEALDVVLSETAADPNGTAGLIFAVIEYASWVSANTGELHNGDEET